MKTPKNTQAPQRGRFSRLKTLTMAAVLITPATVFGQAFWNGGTSDFNVAGSWSPSGVPTGNSANDSGSNNVVLIQAGDPVWGHGDTLAGQGTGASGSYLQTGSTNNTGYPSGGSWMRLGIGTGGTFGSYILSNGVVNVAGQTHLGENGSGYLEVDGGTYNTGYNGNPGICAGDGDGNSSSPSGTLVLTGGTINNINNETWFGEARSSCAGTLIMSGGTFNANNWFVFGRNGAIGLGTMTAGTINFTGGGQFLIGGGGIGSLAQSGGVINVHNQYLVPQGGVAGTNILSGTAVLNVHSWVAVGRNGGYGEMDVSGNAVITRDTANDSNSHLDVGASGKGILNQDGGAITNLANAVYIGESGNGTWNLNSGIANLGAVIMCLNGSATATLNVNGGLLQVSGINSSSSGGSTLNLNGGTIQASAASSTFISGLTLALMGAGGITIDSQGYNITIPQEIDDNGGGTLTKTGTGTLTLTGPNSYSGATLVNAGTLATTTAASTGSSGYSIADGAALNVQVASAGTQFGVPGISFASGATTLTLDLNTFGTPSVAPLNVGGTLAVNGLVTVNVLAAAPVAIGAVPLMQYSSQTGSGSFVLGAVPPGETAYLTNTGSLLELVITSAGAPVWTGSISGAWDISTTANWTDLISGSPTTYHNGEPILFDDTATGTTNVVLNTTVSPGSMTVNNNSLAYTLTGSGKISGTTGLLKEGTSTLTLLNTGGNSYTGPTIIAGGILSVTNLANGGSPSAIGASSASSTNLEMAGGTLSYSGPAVSVNRGYDIQTNSVFDTESNLTLSGLVTTVSGAGFAKTGPAQLTYATAGVNALSGSQGYNVLEGAVWFVGSGAGQTNMVGGVLDLDSTNAVDASVILTNAVLNVQGRVNVGQALGTGTLVVKSGGVLNGTGTIDVGDGGGVAASTGTINQTGGTLSSSGEMWIGQGNSGAGNYNLSSGTLVMANWLAVGRAGGVGTLTISGNGVLNDIGGGGGNFDIGTSGGIGGLSGTGIVNQTGGSITNTASQTWLGEGSSGEPATGTWNMSGGTALLGQLNVGQGGTGTSTLNLSGAGTITCNGYVDLSLGGGTTGNMNIGSVSQPGGSLTAQGDMTVGDQGNAVLNMVTNGGGLLTVKGTMYLSRGSATAFGSVNLNAGSTIVTAYLNNGWGFGHGISNNPQSFNFNGGTLKAYVGSTFFIQPYVNTVVQAGGAIIDDGGYSISANSAFADGGGGGGLTKQGNGTLYLNGANTYTGTTLVSTGALGSMGSFAGPVTVASGATLLGDAGSIGTFFINNALTLSAGSTTIMKLTPSSNDSIAGLTTVSYGGALVITNTSGTPLTGGSVYQLFHAAGPGSGNFSSVTILPSGSGTFNPATGLLTIGSTAVVMNSPVLSGGNLILTGSGGSANGSYSLLSTTNLLVPWITNSTGTFSGTGMFSNSIPINPAVPMQFFRVGP